MSWPRAILFDLDGTLIDAAPDLARSVNILLGEQHCPPLSVKTVRAMIGNGITVLVERAFTAVGYPLTGTALDHAAARMRVIYADNLTVETVLLDGARDAITDGKNSGAQLAIVTNKPGTLAHAILVHFGLADQFCAIIGADDGFAAKPSPAPLLAALAHLRFDVGDAVMVGDSAIDVAAARAADVPVIIVGSSGAADYGVGGYPDCVIRDLSDLSAALRQLAATRLLG